MLTVIVTVTLMQVTVITLTLALMVRRCLACGRRRCSACCSSHCKEELVVVLASCLYTATHTAIYLPTLDIYLQRLDRNIYNKIVDRCSPIVMFSPQV